MPSPSADFPLPTSPARTDEILPPETRRPSIRSSEANPVGTVSGAAPGVIASIRATTPSGDPPPFPAAAHYRSARRWRARRARRVGQRVTRFGAAGLTGRRDELTQHLHGGLRPAHREAG